MTKTRSTVAALAAAAMLITMTACSNTPNVDTPASPPPDMTAPATDTPASLPTGSIGEGATPLETPTPTLNAGGLRSVKWGTPVETKGVVITISEPAPFKPTTDVYPSRYAGSAALKVQVTLKNESNEAVRPYDIGMLATVADAEASPITDLGPGIGRTPGALILPTRSVKYWLGFATAPNDSTFAIQAYNLNDRAGVWSSNG